MSLDDKLREILVTGYADFDEDGEVTYNSLVAQIKQAFEDAGYSKNIQTLKNSDIQPLTLVEDYVGNGKFEDKLTGQEWYDRFEREAPMSTEPHVFEAARRAAGLQETEE